MESIYEIEGYQEEIWDAKTRKCLGLRRVSQDPQRAYGTQGERESVLTESITIQSGHKTCLVKATPKKPVKIFTRYLPICGRLKADIHNGR